MAGLFPPSLCFGGSQPTNATSRCSRLSAPHKKARTAWGSSVLSHLAWVERFHQTAGSRGFPAWCYQVFGAFTCDSRETLSSIEESSRQDATSPYMPPRFQCLRRCLVLPLQVHHRRPRQLQVRVVSCLRVGEAPRLVGSKQSRALWNWSLLSARTGDVNSGSRSVSASSGPLVSAIGQLALSWYRLVSFGRCSATPSDPLRRLCHSQFPPSPRGLSSCYFRVPLPRSCLPISAGPT